MKLSKLIILPLFILGANYVVADNPSTNKCEHYFETDIVDVHSNAPGFTVKADAGGPYSLIGTNVVVSLKGNIENETPGEHWIFTTISPCKWCGEPYSGKQPDPSKYGTSYETNEVTYSWDFNNTSGSGTGKSFSETNTVYETGKYDFNAYFTGQRIACSLCRTNDMALTNCIVVKMDLIIHKPKVIDADEPEIPEADEMTKGSATFVNLDNDDKDQFFDNNPDGTPDAYVTDGDNELVKVTMRLQPKSMFSSGSVKLEITAGAEYVKMYKAETKAFTKTYNSGDYIPVDDFIVDGDTLKKDIWVEGIGPHSEPRQTELKMTYDVMPDLTDEVALTVIGVEEVEWKAIGVQIIEEDPNWPEGLSPQGWRVFPDKYLPAEEAASHEKVNVSVQFSVEPPFPIKFYLRAFDVDDPSFNEGVVDDEQNASDNVYPNDSAEPDWQKQNPTCGKFEGFNKAFNITELNLLPGSKTNSAVFCLSPCPGDNFRVVASGDKSFLEQLENNDTILNIGETKLEKLQNLQRIIDPMATGVPSGAPSVQEVRVSQKYCSRTLTTWRKLWIERDSMEQIPEEEKWIKGKVINEIVKTDAGNNQYATVFAAMLKLYSGTYASRDEYEGGNLYFEIINEAGVSELMGRPDRAGPFYIIRSSNLGTIVGLEDWIAGFDIYPAISSNQLAKLQAADHVYLKAQDDADYSMFDLPAKPLNIDNLGSAYRELYIDPVYADAFSRKTLPYKREITYLDMFVYVEKGRELPSSSIWLWTTRIIKAFEGDSTLIPLLNQVITVDFDPDGVVDRDRLYPLYQSQDLCGPPVKHFYDRLLFGIENPLNHTGCIFNEVLRDYNTTYAPDSKNINVESGLESIVIHEITHGGNIYTGHSEKLMDIDGEKVMSETEFDLITKHKLRKIDTW